MTKQFLKSTSIQGNLVSLLGVLNIIFQWQLLPEDMNAAVSGLFAVIGIIYSIYGRYKTNGEKLTLL